MTSFENHYTEVRKCECCGRDNGPVLVLGSGTGPMSIAYCQDCASCGAEPRWALQYLWDFVADRKVEALHESVRNFRVWNPDEGRYMTWDEWVANEIANPRPDDYMEQYEASCREPEQNAEIREENAVDFEDLSKLGFEVVKPTQNDPK